MVSCAGFSEGVWLSVGLISEVVFDLSKLSRLFSMESGFRSAVET